MASAMLGQSLKPGAASLVVAGAQVPKAASGSFLVGIGREQGQNSVASK